MAGLFRRGYEAVQEEKERQEKIKENSGKKLFEFFLQNDKDEADLRFLTEEPVTFQRHTVKGSRNGKETFDSYTCEGDGCPLCAEGNKSSFCGAYLVVDKRPYEYKKDGKTIKRDKSIKLFAYGNRVLSQLDRISSKYGLTTREITMVRLGKGTDTTYTFERGDEKLKPVKSEDIEALLTDKLKESYDGTVGSLYDIVEEQLMMRTKSFMDNGGLEEEDDEEIEDNSSDIVGMGDDDEEEAPKKAPTQAKRSLFKAKGSASMKPKTGAKSLLKKVNS